MNASRQFPFDLSWTPDDLADAVPTRLSELVRFDAQRDGGDVHSANSGSLNSRRWTPVPRHGAEPALFRIG